MKLLILIMSLAISVNAFAQDADKTVTLVVSGQGKTQDEAKQVALRSAIEQAFGAFISSKTEILNDKLVKDEIVSLVNGNIQKFEIISEVKIPEGGYATTLKATVSVSKLTSFCENKGVAVEFKGGVFAANIKIQQLNEENEITILKALCQTLKTIADFSFNYSVKATEPTAKDNKPNEWIINLNIDIAANKNLILFKDYLIKGLEGLSMSIDEQNNFQKLNKRNYKVTIDGKEFTLRNFPSIGILQDLCWYLYFAQANFFVNDGINSYSPYDKADKPYKNHYPISYDLNEMNVIDFKIPREFKSNWNIIEFQKLEYSESDYLNNTPFGGFETSRSSTTYALTKKAITLKYNYIKESYQNHIEKYNSLTENQKREGIYDYARYAQNDEAKLRCFADSSTICMSGRGDYSPDYPIYKDGSYLKIHSYPGSEQYAVITLQLTYKTDELIKITSFSVKPGKLEDEN